MRAADAEPEPESPRRLMLDFLHESKPLRAQELLLTPSPGRSGARELLGWFQAPHGATHVRVSLEAGSAPQLRKVDMHPVAERDPKCHPLANTPRWDTYRPPFPIERVVLPASLEPLADELRDVRVEWVRQPRSLRKLAATVLGSACAIDPRWVEPLDLRLKDVELVAGACLMILDLDTFASLARRAGALDVEVRTTRAAHEIMSARVQYADVPTRGFALMDVLPFGVIAAGRFVARALPAGRAWRAYAHSTDFAELLTSETPSAARSGDVLAAIRAIGAGELIVSDVPWLAAGVFGPALAPRLAAHLLRMHLALPLEDCVQYWNRWDDAQVVLRDIADLSRRYRLLRPVRWASGPTRLAHLGVALQPAAARRRLVLRSGRIDRCAVHDGVPPEPMMILMKSFAREVAERTPWAVRHLCDSTLVWQFDTAEGLRYAVHYDSAETLGPTPEAGCLRLRSDDRRRSSVEARGPDERLMPLDVGVHGDRSLEYQRDLTHAVRQWIEMQPG
ncbi:MAG: hypothetical protein HRF50_04840 [Phycisphaerae bacterium]